MARKTVTTTVEGDEDDDKDITGADIERDEDVIRALTEIEGSDEIRWQIYRLSEPDSGFVVVLSTAELSVERIAELGAGRYRVRGIRENGTYFKSKIITIAKRPQPVGGGVLTDLLEQTKTKNIEPLQMMTLLMNQQQNSQQQMTQVMVAALGRKEESKTEIPWGAIVAAIPPSLVALKEFFSSKADPMKQMMDAIALTEKLRGDGDKPGTTWPDLLKEGLATIPATLQSLRSTPPDTSPTVTASTVEVPLAIKPPSQTPEAVMPPADMNIQLIGWFRELIAKWFKAAQRNGNPELYAELFIDELPDSITDDQIISMLGADDWWMKLVAFESKLAPYQGWFTQLRAHILSNFVSESDEDDTDRRDHSAETRSATPGPDTDQE